jgi:hypothetical protein
LWIKDQNNLPYFQILDFSPPFSSGLSVRQIVPNEPHPEVVSQHLAVKPLSSPKELTVGKQGLWQIGVLSPHQEQIGSDWIRISGV